MLHVDADGLLTVRDHLRLAVSRFRRHRLTYGHGTYTATDEAAFLILTALDLPHDDLEPWLDCRLTATERENVVGLIEARITSRKPAPYLVNTAYMLGHRFYVDERVIVPRSYIGELLADGLAPAVADPDDVATVLDLCTGSGCLAILAALVMPNARIDAVDVCGDALAVAARNVADYGLDDRITLLTSDLFDALPADGRYDVIVANPPYVADAEVAAFDPEYRAEPEIAHAGGADGLDVVRRIVAAAPARLTPGGVLVMEIGTGRPAFEAAYPTLDVTWLATATSEDEVFAVTAAALAACG
jgi:ribosomal protein L3 glutamine methyltransferase